MLNEKYVHLEAVWFCFVFFFFVFFLFFFGFNAGLWYCFRIVLRFYAVNCYEMNVCALTAVAFFSFEAEFPDKLSFTTSVNCYEMYAWATKCVLKLLMLFLLDCRSQRVNCRDLVMEVYARARENLLHSSPSRAIPLLSTLSHLALLVSFILSVRLTSTIIPLCGLTPSITSKTAFAHREIQKQMQLKTEERG